MAANGEESATILLVDDDRIHSRILRAQLEREGFRVEVADSGIDGLAKATHHRPAVILCDWMMQGMNGIELCRLVKQDAHLSNVYFILLTSLSEVQDRVEGLDSGADDFLSKPVVAVELLARVRAGLRLHRANERLATIAQELQHKQNQLDSELNEASAYLRKLLPQPLQGAVRVDHLFLPSQRLGGDCLDYRWIDADHLLFYVLDVAGHGLGATLPSLSVWHELRSEKLLAHIRHPERVLSELNRAFPMEEQAGRYFTLWFGIYQRSTQQLRYARAGHPPALLISSVAHEPIQRLTTGGMAIGLFEDAIFECGSCGVDPGMTLLVYTDGIYEHAIGADRSQPLEAFISTLPRQELGSSEEGLDHMISNHRNVIGGQVFEDDISLLRLRF
jgi:sigma-B regulation protein RsbU (phosphoserine phosphatase)